MANYIAWYGKKRERLLEVELEFVELLEKETNESLLVEAAEGVRVAQIRALKAKRAQFPPSEKNAAAVANLDLEIQFWLSLTVKQVIDGYRIGRLRGHRATAVRVSRSNIKLD